MISPSEAVVVLADSLDELVRRVEFTINERITELDNHVPDYLWNDELQEEYEDLLIAKSIIDACNRSVDQTPGNKTPEDDQKEQP